MCLPGFALPAKGMSARLSVTFKVSQDQALPPAHVPVTLHAGDPARLQLARHLQDNFKPVAKGDRLCPDGTLIGLVDQWGNCCARGPDEAPWIAKVTGQNVILRSNKQTELVKLNNGQMSVPDLIALGPVGADATVSIKINGTDIVGANLINRRIFEVHLGFTHDWLKFDVRTSRRQAEGSEDKQKQQELKIRFPHIRNFFCLDLLNRVANFQKGAGTHTGNKPLDTQTWSSQEDLLTGLEEKIDGSVIRPNGRRYSPKERQALVQELNSLLSSNKAVHEVACVVEPGIRELSGLGLQVCNAADDSVDPDCDCSIKMHLAVKAWPELSVTLERFELPDLRYHLSGEAAMKFQVNLPDGLFNKSPCADIVFADSHNPEKVYGRFFLRQAPRPSRLRVLPVGQVFVDAPIKKGASCGVLQRSEAQPSAARAATTAAGSAPPAAAADTCTTLGGWKLFLDAGGSYSSIPVTFDNLEDVEVQAPGPIMERNNPFRLYFVCSDQYGVPVEMPADLREQIEQHAELKVSCEQQLAGAPEASAPSRTCRGASAASSGAAETSGSRRAPTALTASIVPGSWHWGTLLVPVRAPERPWQMPCFSLEMVVDSGSGPAVLELQLQTPPAPGLPLPSRLNLGAIQLPIMVAAKAMRPDGYIVSSTNHAVSVRVIPTALVQATETEEEDEEEERPVEEDGSGRKRRKPADYAAQRGPLQGGRVGVSESHRRTRQGNSIINTAPAREATAAGEPGSQAATGVRAVQMEVKCPEDQKTALEIQLVDDDGEPLLRMREPEFVMEAHPSLSADLECKPGQLLLTLQAPRVPRAAHCPNAAADPEMQRTVADDAGASDAGALSIMHVSIRPVSPHVSHVLPVDIRVLVLPGLYPQSLELIASHDWSTEPETLCYQVPYNAESPEHEFHLPSIRVVAANGLTWQPGPMETCPQISLAWQMQDIDSNVAGDYVTDGPRVPSVYPVSATSAPDDTARMKMPTRTGRWRLVASMQGLDPCTIKKVTVHPGRPRRLQLEDSDSPEWQAIERYPLKTVVQRGEATQQQQQQHAVDMPKLDGYLVDCQGNQALVKLDHRVVLCIRTGGIDVDFKEAVATRSFPFRIVPSSTLLQMIAAAEEAVQNQGASDPESADVAPTYDLVLRCTEKKENGRWTPLAENDKVEELPIATLVVMSAGADEETKRLTQEVNDMANKISMIEKSKQDAAERMRNMEQQVQRFASNVLLKEQEVQKYGGNLEAALKLCQSQIVSATNQIENGPMEILEPRTPWLYKPWFSGQPPLSNDEHNICKLAARMTSLASRPMGVIGPLICLGAVERRKVSSVLASITSRKKLFCVVVDGDHALAAVELFLKQHNITRNTIMNVADTNIWQTFSTNSIRPNDPQRRLQFSDYERVLEEFKCPGFVGFACNLVRLPQELLDWTVKTSRGALSLRQSVLFHCFRDTMVFESKGHMDEFRKRCAQMRILLRTRLVSLDGSSYTTGIHSSDDCPSFAFGWSMVPSSLQLSGAVDGSVSQMLAEIIALHNQKQTLERLGPGLECDKNNLNKAATEAQRSRKQMEEKNAGFDAQISELRMAMHDADVRLKKLRAEKAALGQDDSGAAGKAGKGKRSFGSRAGAKHRNDAPGTSAAAEQTNADRRDAAGEERPVTRQRRA